MPETEAAKRARFGPFTLDVNSGELRKHERKLKLGEQPFQILSLLLERRGEMVSREELQKRLWKGDTFVDFEHGLNSAMRRLRDALGEEQEAPRWVETVPRRGYRFIGEVEWEKNGVDAAAGTVPTANLEASATESMEGKSETGRWWGVWAVAAALLVLGGWLAWRAEAGRKRAGLAAEVKTLAVLPLENLSGDAKQDYFADGMTDELITELAKSQGLRVISRTSVMQYKNARRPLPEIGRELGADAIVEGTMSLNGNKVRVTAQLIHVATDTHLWAQSYERDVNDALALQEELARNIASELKTTIVASGGKSKRVNPAAYDNYLRGRYAFLSGNGDAARAYYEKAIEVQPDYAQAYSGLADYYTAGAEEGDLDPREALPRAKKYAKQAVELDATIGEAHHALAALYLFGDWNWKKAEEEERRAIELKPNDAETYHLLSYILFAEGRVDEAVEAQRKGADVDHFSRPWALGYVLACANRYEEAEAVLRQEIDVRSTNADVRQTLAMTLLRQGKDKEAAEQFAEQMRLEGNKEFAEAIEKAYGEGGNGAVQQLDLKRMEAYAKESYVSPLIFALIYGRMEDRKNTMAWLNKAYTARAPRLVRMWMEPEWKWLHGDKEFQELSKRVGVAQF